MKMLSSFNWFYLGSMVKKIAGNFPAVDGPGSYDQPNRNFVSITAVICEKVRKINKIFNFSVPHNKKGLREIRRPILTSSFDEYLFLFGEFLFFLLRKGEVQYTVFETCFDVLLGDVLADIEASLH